MNRPDTQLPVHAASLVGGSATSASRLGGGSLSEIWRVELADGRVVVAKNGPAPLAEAAMLRAIRASGAPVPRVLAADTTALVIEALAAGSGPESDWPGLGSALRILHSCVGDRFGWDDDYAFGNVPIINRWRDEWPEFWGEFRLGGPGRDLAPAHARRLDILVRGLSGRLPARPVPGLLHGDMWGGNVLVAGGTLTGLVDPACYFGHSEVDLAMLELFDSPPQSFFDSYGPLESGFAERLPIYQLWPAIVHVRLFGAAYHPMLERLLSAAGV